MKTRAAVIVALLTLGVMPGGAGATAGPQEETGTIIFPIPDPQTGGASCFQGVPRRINMASQGTVSGPFGVIFDVDKATWNGKFKLDVATGPTGQEDLDIYFFLNFGPGIPEDPSMNSPSIIGTYNNAAVGGEKGSIPAESTKAIVCMKGGIIADFEYVGTPPKKKKKG
jgi:hypothetical protein